MLPLLLATIIVGVCVVVSVVSAGGGGVAAAAVDVDVDGVAFAPNELCACFVQIDHYCVASIAGKLQLSEK